MIFAELSDAGSRRRQVLHPGPLGWQLMRWVLWNSFYKQDVKGHDDAGDCHSSVQPGSNHRSFVEHTPHSLLLWQQPGFETRNFLEVGTGANKEQAKHQNPIQGVHCYGKERKPLVLITWGQVVPLGNSKEHRVIHYQEDNLNTVPAADMREQGPGTSEVSLRFPKVACRHPPYNNFTGPCPPLPSPFKN